MQGAEGEAQPAYGVAGGVHRLEGNRLPSAWAREYSGNAESDGRYNPHLPLVGIFLNDMDATWNTLSILGNGTLRHQASCYDFVAHDLMLLLNLSAKKL